MYMVYIAVDIFFSYSRKNLKKKTYPENECQISDSDSAVSCKPVRFNISA